MSPFTRRPFPKSGVLAVVAGATLGLAWACDETALIGFEGNAGASGSGNGGAGAAAANGGSGANGGQAGETGGRGGTMCADVTCEGKTFACGDCADNDDDGLLDARDPECVGSCDDTEDALDDGLSGQNNATCRHDCYFDQDTGSGNDGCYWSHQCDPLIPSPTCAYDPAQKIPGAPGDCAFLMNQQSAACGEFCVSLTPNGCDCFGCCELPAGSGQFRYIGAEKDGKGTCDMKNADDPERCPPCTAVGACLNACAHCELCVGKTTLPDDCSDGGSGGSGGSGQCPDGIQPCGLPDQPECPPNKYCLTGCCYDIIQ